MEVYSGNTILLASRRWFIFWDIPTGKCDQRMSKSARKTMFYRPDWVKAAAGANICTAVCPGNHLLAAGSEDGYMFVYENESGMPVGMKAPATKHQAPVSCKHAYMHIYIGKIAIWDISLVYHVYFLLVS